eukprot:4622004-Pyramimonas_sp.AAC.1
MQSPRLSMSLTGSKTHRLSLQPCAETVCQELQIGREASSPSHRVDILNVVPIQDFVIDVVVWSQHCPMSSGEKPK